MQNSEKAWLGMHPMVVFWLGVLTGAVVITLIFFYRFMSVVDFQSTLFKTQVMQRGTQQQVNPSLRPSSSLKKSSNPAKTNNVRGAAGNTEAIGLPPGY